MRMLLGSLALIFSLFAASAQADIAKMYFGAGLTDGSVEVGASDKSLGTINATIGFHLYDFVGIELALGSASDQAGSVLSEPLLNYQAALLRLGYRWDRVGAYVLGGQARLDIENNLNSSSGGAAVGLGFNLFGSETTALNFHVLSIDGGAFSTASLGFQYFFGGFR